MYFVSYVFFVKDDTILLTAPPGESNNNCEYKTNFSAALFNKVSRLKLPTNMNAHAQPFSDNKHMQSIIISVCSAKLSMEFWMASK